MKILVTSPHCRPDWINKLGVESQGGQTVVMNELYVAMAKEYPEVWIDIYTRFQDDDPFAKDSIKNLGVDRVRLIRLPCGPTDYYVPKEELYGKYIDQFMENIFNFAQNERVRYDILHGHYADGWETVRKYSVKARVPYVLTTHSLGRNKQKDCLERGEGTEKELDKKYNFTTRIESEEKSLAGCAKLFTLSSFEKKFVLENYDALKQRSDDICPIPNGLSFELFSEEVSEEMKAEIRNRIGVNLDEFMVLIPSRLDERKGQLNAVNALGEVKPEIKKKIKLVILCWPEKTESYAQAVQEVIDKNNLERLTIKIPAVPRSKIFEFFNAADAVLLPCQEYFSMVMLEGMYLRKPVIASKFSGAIDALEDGRSGILVDHNNISELGGAIEKVFTMSKEERFKMGQLAREKVEKDYTWKAVSKKLYEQYLEILDRRP